MVVCNRIVIFYVAVAIVVIAVVVAVATVNDCVAVAIRLLIESLQEL
jgi:hypothetical protein